MRDQCQRELGFMELNTEIIPTLFRERTSAWSDNIAFRHKELGLWKSVTWGRYGQLAGYVASALVHIGLQKGDRVTIMSENCPEWVYADMGGLLAGGISAGIYPTDSDNQVHYILDNCRSRFHFVENEEQLDKILSVRSQLAALKKIIVFDMKGLKRFDDPMVMSFDSLLALGKSFEKDTASEIESRLSAIQPDDPAVIIYTSGTTGPPKGAMLSHRNIVATNHMQNTANPCYADDEVLSFLPLCHIAERNISVMNPLIVGYKINFAEGLDTVFENIQEIAPTVFFAVPRIWEKFYSTIVLAVNDGTWLEKKIYGWAIRNGERLADARRADNSAPLKLRTWAVLGNWLALRNLKKSIGLHRARQLTSGAAPISKDLLKFYNAFGLPMREVYGQTECCGPATIHHGDDVKVGTVGKALPGVQVKLSRQGEILIKGPNVFLGYFGAPEKTEETITTDGWLRTGDVGRLDEDGHLVVTDRMKDIIVTAGGKNITPSEIENQLKFSPYINDAVVIGDRRKYLSALIMIDEENTMRYAQENRVPFTTYSSLTRAQEIVELIEKEIDAVNRQFARVEQLKAFRLIDTKLTADDEEVTPTMKLKRKYVSEKFSDLIESMY